MKIYNCWHSIPFQHTPRSWIEANFQKRECVKFIPSPKDEEKWVIWFVSKQWNFQTANLDIDCLITSSKPTLCVDTSLTFYVREESHNRIELQASFSVGIHCGKRRHTKSARDKTFVNYCVNYCEFNLRYYGKFTAGMRGCLIKKRLPSAKVQLKISLNSALMSGAFYSG